jgi:molybdopterin converting factor small subunit
MCRNKSPFKGLGGKKNRGTKNIGVNIMEVKVLFFDVLAEVSGTSVKHYHDVKSISDLKIKIYDDFPEIVHYNFQISVNREITNNDVFLKSGDEIALMPFAGG